MKELMEKDKTEYLRIKSEKQRKWVSENKERHNENLRKWREANREAVRFYDRKHKQKVKNAKLRTTASQVAA